MSKIESNTSFIPESESIISSKKQEVRNQIFEEGEMSWFLQISSKDDIKKVDNPQNIEVIHIRKQTPSSMKDVLWIVNNFPNLKYVSVVPSAKDRYGEDKLKIFEERGIEFEIKRQSESDQYDRPSRNDEFNIKKQLYESVFENNDKPDIKKLLTQMNDLGLIDLRLVHKYLRSDQTTMSKVAEELKVNPNNVRNEITIILSIMGYTYGENIKNLAKMRQSNFERVMKAKGQRIEKKQSELELRESYAVDYKTTKILPPPSLVKQRLGDWKRLQELILYDPKKWIDFSFSNPKHAATLKCFYQLMENRGKYMSLRDMQEKFSYTSNVGLYYLVGSGLKILFGETD